MTHEFFRYLIPGIAVYISILAGEWVHSLYTQTPPQRMGSNTITMLSLLVLPTGWIVYQTWRAFWQLYRGGYEPRAFLNRIREGTHIYAQESDSRVVVDFSNFLNEAVGMRWFSEAEFQCVFDPFRKLSSSIGFQNKTNRVRRAKGCSKYLHFVEPISDLILFSDSSYDYARSIASVRYGIQVSSFAFVCGAGLAVILIPRTTSLVSKAVSMSLVILMFALVILLRASMAKREHEARVQLITQINSKDRGIQDKDLNAVLSEDLRSHLARIEDQVPTLRSGPKLAAFDMDGTLIQHDMGDAVLAMLIVKGLVPMSAWEVYVRILGYSRPEAYKWAVTVMKGLREIDVMSAASEVLALPLGHAIKVTQHISVPRPIIIPQMQSLVMWLHRHKFEVYIVTATNRWAAAIVGADYFGIDQSHVIGLDVEVGRDGILTDKLKVPAPISTGKLDAWKERLGNRQPIIGAGDSEGDHALLSFVLKSGLVVWMGDEAQRPDHNHIIYLDSLRTSGDAFAAEV